MYSWNTLWTVSICMVSAMCDSTALHILACSSICPFLMLIFPWEKENIIMEIAWVSCSVSVFSQTVNLGVLMLGIRTESFFRVKKKSLRCNEVIRSSKQKCSVYFKIMHHIFCILVSIIRFLTVASDHNHRVNLVM